MKTLLFGNGVVSLEGVYQYQNIDVAPKAAFDDLTNLAACVCQTPIALLYLINARGWLLKSQVGLDSDSTDSYLALCTETVSQAESRDSPVMVVPDALADERFASYELVSASQQVRFYASTPIITPQGVILGILSVIDRVPRELTLQQQEALAALSRQAISLTVGCANEQFESRKNLTSVKGLVSKRQQMKETLIASYKELTSIKWALEQFAIVAITDHQGTINYVNDKFCEISQYSQEELLGQNHRIINSGYHSADFFKQMWATISSGKVWKGEIKNRAKDGSFYWVDTTIVPILNAHQKPYEYVSIHQDITERKRVEKEQESFFTLLPNLLCIASLDGYFKRVNPAFEATLLYTSEELLSRPFLNFVHPEDKAATLAELEKLATKASSIHFENRYQCKDGSYKWLSWNSFPLIEEGLIYAIAHDITDSKQTKATLLERSCHSTLEADVGAALRQSSTLPESLQRCTEAMVQHLDAIGAGIWTVDQAAVGTQTPLPLELQASSGQLAPTYIFPHHIAPNHPLIDAIVQTRQPVNIQLFNQGRHTGTAPTNLSTFFSGYPLIVESRLVGVITLLSRQPFSKVVQGVLGWVANTIAIAIDRAWAREELLSRREALLFQLASQIRNSLDLDTILGIAVKEIRSLLRVDGCHFLWCFSEFDRPILSVTHEARDPDSPSLLGDCPLPQLAPLAEKIHNLQSLQFDDLASAPELDSETRSLLSDWGITSGLMLPLKTHSGQVGAILCIHYHDPHPWSNREVELLQAVVDQLAIAIEQAELFAKARAAALAAQTQAHHLENTLQELQQTESRLIQTEKLSSLGQMVAGIAHEINNPVNFITGNLCHATTYIQDLLDLIDRYQRHYPKPVESIQEHIEAIDLEFLIEDLPKMLSSMQMGADRIQEIVLSLRNFSRLDEAEMKPFNIHDGINSTLLILHNRLKPSGHNPGITIIKEYGNLPPVECYPGQLCQVFMNIISNAIDALESKREEDSGTEEECTQSPDHLVTRSRTIWISTEILDGTQAVIRIRDNGPGMPPSVVRRLFDPFFTTKPVGKGTGLGLSISYQIVVEKHGGILQCFSEQRQGSEFWIQIPIAPLDASMPSETSEG
jgi:PAS domain S-box-containing protein